MKQERIYNHKSLDDQFKNKHERCLSCSDEGLGAEYPVQLRDDFRDDIHQIQGDCIIWLHRKGLSAQLEERLVATLLQ